MQQCKVVIVEGLIGSGKTTLSRELGQALGSQTLTLFEPDEKEGRNPYLSDYYHSAERWAFTMQTHLLASRYRMHMHAQWHAMQGHGDTVIDRSVYGDTAFARLQLRLGLMEQREFDTYSALYHAMTATILHPSICLRVLVSPERCNERISRRMQQETGRVCESSIDLRYLRMLDQEIDHMVEVLKAQGVTVLDIPWDDDRSDPESRKQAVEAICARIRNITVRDRFLDLHRRAV